MNKILSIVTVLALSASLAVVGCQDDENTDTPAGMGGEDNAGGSNSGTGGDAPTGGADVGGAGGDVAGGAGGVGGAE